MPTEGDDYSRHYLERICRRNILGEIIDMGGKGHSLDSHPLPIPGHTQMVMSMSSQDILSGHPGDKMMRVGNRAEIMAREGGLMRDKRRYLQRRCAQMQREKIDRRRRDKRGSCMPGISDDIDDEQGKGTDMKSGVRIRPASVANKRLFPPIKKVQKVGTIDVNKIVEISKAANAKNNDKRKGGRNKTMGRKGAKSPQQQPRLNFSAIIDPSALKSFFRTAVPSGQLGSRKSIILPSPQSTHSPRHPQATPVSSMGMSRVMISSDNLSYPCTGDNVHAPITLHSIEDRGTVHSMSSEDPLPPILLSSGNNHQGKDRARELKMKGLFFKKIVPGDKLPRMPARTPNRLSPQRRREREVLLPMYTPQGKY